MKLNPGYLFIVVLFSIAISGFGKNYRSSDSLKISAANKRSINIYVISKDKYFDITNRLIVWQTKFISLFHHKKLRVIFASSTADAEKKIRALVTRHHYVIHTLWFDSHGKYRKGYSSLMIGNDEYSYKNIADTAYTATLKKIASYCNANTRIGLGSCYAAADYNFPVAKNGKYESMHGDSLIKTMGNIFAESDIYASKSWVMAKPFIFGGRNALAGYPLNKEYKDSIFFPAWKSMGEWHRYSQAKKQIEIINTIYLSATGEILINDRTYLTKKKAQRKLARNLKRLRPDLYDLREM